MNKAVLLALAVSIFTGSLALGLTWCTLDVYEYYCDYWENGVRCDALCGGVLYTTKSICSDHSSSTHHFEWDRGRYPGLCPDHGGTEGW